MEPLADVITLLRPRAAETKVIYGAGRWGVRRSRGAYASFGLVLTGGCWSIVLKKSKIERRQKSRKCQFLDDSVAQMPRSADTKLHGRFSEK
jgi:hypothetical protein